MRIHRVYCKSVSGPNQIFKIDETQSHHLIRALRLKEEDIVEGSNDYFTTHWNNYGVIDYLWSWSFKTNTY